MGREMCYCIGKDQMACYCLSVDLLPFGAFMCIDKYTLDIKSL